METYYLSNNGPDEIRLPAKVTRWQPLLLLSIFRIALSGVFCFLYLIGKLLPPFGSHDSRLFFWASLLYLIIGSLLLVLHQLRRFPFGFHVYAGVLTDIILIIILMHASGGIESGLGVLLIVTIATGSIVTGGRSALGFAALASIFLLAQQFYMSIVYPGNSNYPAAGLFGITYFITALVFVFLGQRISESEELAKKRGIDLANMAQLTEHIIQRMQTGVVVIDQYGVIRLINESAAHMLGLNSDQENMHLSALAPELAEQWEKWKKHPERTPETIQLMHNPMDISPRFAQIGDDLEAGALVFLQDMAAMAQQAQQLQLASLGRLTASIAHEIRNPLGAISHAGQLLAESPHLDKSDLRMTQIIADHSQRLNTIIENVMGLSRRQRTKIKLINLKEFIDDFVSEYTLAHQLNPGDVQILIMPEDTQVRFDKGHLQQILYNLCDNGLRHSKDGHGSSRLILKGGHDKSSSRPHLDIIDSGPGVKPEAMNGLFEPFFTTETRGTGLGLYLSRELAESNQAHLNYIQTEDGNGYFRITFQDPRRQFD